MNILSLVQTALELGLICSLTVLALFLSYSMLNVCDLSTDGCFTLGAAVGATVAIAGHPYLAILAAMAAGVLSGVCIYRFDRKAFQETPGLTPREAHIVALSLAIVTAPWTFFIPVWRKKCFPRNQIAAFSVHKDERRRIFYEYEKVVPVFDAIRLRLPPGGLCGLGRNRR